MGEIHRPLPAALLRLLLRRRTVSLGVRLERRSLPLLGSLFVGVNVAKDGEESRRAERAGPGRGEFWGHDAERRRAQEERAMLPGLIPDWRTPGRRERHVCLLSVSKRERTCKFVKCPQPATAGKPFKCRYLKGNSFFCTSKCVYRSGGVPVFHKGRELSLVNPEGPVWNDGRRFKA